MSGVPRPARRVTLDELTPAGVTVMICYAWGTARGWARTAGSPVWDPRWPVAGPDRTAHGHRQHRAPDLAAAGRRLLLSPIDSRIGRRSTKCSSPPDPQSVTAPGQR
jgi:hypothetical protein